MLLMVSQLNFDQEWAASDLADVFSDIRRVVVLPILSDEGWASDSGIWKEDYIESEEAVYRYKRPFSGYLIDPQNVRILNYREESLLSIKQKMEQSDALLLVADDPLSAMHVLEDSGLSELLRAYSGLLIGVGTGAEILMDTYRSTVAGEIQDGLGICSGFGLCMGYNEQLLQVRQIIDDLETRRDTVAICPPKGGLLIDGDQVDLLGDAFFADNRDLDDLYELVTVLGDQE